MHDPLSPDASRQKIPQAAHPMDPTALLHLSGHIDEGICLCEVITRTPADFRFLSVNDAFTRVSGLGDPVGHSLRDLMPVNDDSWVRQVVDTVLSGTPRRLRLGSMAQGRVLDAFVVPLARPGRFIAQFRDAIAEEELKAAHASALQQSGSLLDELNHRVMNSLGIISAIISMEVRATGSDQDVSPLRRVGQRVRAVADLYKTLNAGTSVTEVCVGKYIRQIVDNVFDSIGQTQGIQVETDIIALRISSRLAAPLGLMVNELVTNALKYAFSDGREGTIRVSLENRDALLCLTVADNGNGMDGASTPKSGAGRNLVQAFATQIDGHVSTSSSEEGTVVTVIFPKG